MSQVISAHEGNFESVVLNHDGTVLVDFYTETCPPCKMMAPIIDKLADDLAGTVKVVKVDASKNANLAQNYGVNSVPTFHLIKDGEIRKIKTGAVPPAQLKSWAGSEL